MSIGLAGNNTKPHMLGNGSVTDTTDKTKLFEPFFGAAPEGPVKTDPYARQANQNLALPDFYKGKSSFLGQTIEMQILNEDDWYTSVMLPIKVTDEISFSWNKWTFDQARVGIVPEEAPSRLISSRFESKSASMERRGIAMQLEHGFMLTEMGRQNYIFNLTQMAYAVSETNKADVIIAYLNCENVNRVWEKRHGHYNARTIRVRLDADRDNWARTQKDEMGLAKLDALSDEEMMRYRGTANTWLLPPKMRLHAKFQPHETDNYLSGKVWSMDSKETFGVLNDKRVYLMRQYDIDVAEMQDLSTRQRQIGQYYLMVDRYSQSRNETDYYTNEERSIIVYDEDADDWAKLTLKVAIDYCNIFDSEGNLKDVKDGEFKNGPHPEDSKHDFLSMKIDHNGKGIENLRPIEVLGQLSEKHFSTPSLIGMARSAVKAMNLTPNELEAVNKFITDATNGKSALLPVDTGGVILSGLAALFKKDAVKTLNKEKDDEKFRAYAHLVVPGNQYYEFDPNTMVAASTLKLAKDALTPPTDNIRKFLRNLEIMFPDSLFLNTKWLSPMSQISSSLSTMILENLFGYVGLPVWTRQTAGNKDVADLGKDALTFADATNLVSIQSFGPLIKNMASKVTNADAAVKAIYALFQLDNDGSYMKSTKNDFGEAQTEINGAEKRRYVIIRNGNKTMSLMPGGAKTASMKLRERLVGLIQNLIIRIISQNPSDAGIALLTTAITIIDEKTKTAAIDVKVGELWRTISDALAGNAELKAFVPTAFVAEAQAALTTADANDGKITQVIAADFGVVQAPAAFYITPLTLSWTQVSEVLTKLGVKVNPSVPDLVAIQFKMDKSPITLSHPTRPNVPITQASDLVALFSMAQSEAINWEAGSIQSTLLVRSLEHAYSLRSGKRRAEDGGDDGDRHRHHHDDEEEEGIQLRVPDNVLIPNLKHNRFANRYEHIETQMVDPLYRLVAKIAAATPFTRKAMHACVANNIILPVNFMVAGPHMNYLMHLGIKAQAGEETGNTYVGHINFEVGDNPQVKMHWAHLTLYTKCNVREPKNVRVFFDIFSGQCLGGAGSAPMELHKYNPRDSQFGDGSLLYLMIAYEEKSLPNPLDLTGHFSYFDDTSNRDQDKDKKVHYSTAFRYNRLYGWRDAADLNKYEVEQLWHPYIHTVEQEKIPFNTVCYHGEQHDFDRIKKSHSHIHTNTGHWGPFCFPGARKLRDGDLNTWKQPVSINSH